MNIIPPGFQRRIHVAAPGPPKLRIVGVHHHLELLNRLHVRRHVKRPVRRNWCPVQQELIRPRPPAVHRKTAIHVPAARP